MHGYLVYICQEGNQCVVAGEFQEVEGHKPNRSLTQTNVPSSSGDPTFKIPNYTLNSARRY